MTTVRSNDIHPMGAPLSTRQRFLVEKHNEIIPYDIAIQKIIDGSTFQFDRENYNFVFPGRDNQKVGQYKTISQALEALKKCVDIDNSEAKYKNVTYFISIEPKQHAKNSNIPWRKLMESITQSPLIKDNNEILVMGPMSSPLLFVVQSKGYDASKVDWMLEQIYSEVFNPFKVTITQRPKEDKNNNSL